PSPTEGDAIYPGTVDPATGAAEQPYTRATWPKPEGDIFLDNNNQVFSSLYPGGGGFLVMLHELGHALGLKHPSDDGGNHRPTFTELGIGDLETTDQTLMIAFLENEGNSGHDATP